MLCPLPLAMRGVLGHFSFLLFLDTYLISSGIFVFCVCFLRSSSSGKGTRCYRRCLCFVNPWSCRVCMKPWKRACLSPLRWGSKGRSGERWLRCEEDRFRAQTFLGRRRYSLQSHSFPRDDLTTHIQIYHKMPLYLPVFSYHTPCAIIIEPLTV